MIGRDEALMLRRKLDIQQLQSVLRQELQLRRLSDQPGDYAHLRQTNDVPLYGVTGATNLHAQLGYPMGNLRNREKWAARINSFQQSDGSFHSPSGVQHAAAMAIIALNLLGLAPARPVRHLAPLNPAWLDTWLNGLDWSGTHKDFCSAVAPILASGFWDTPWLEVLRRNVEARLDPRHPLRTWCGEQAPVYQVISCIYHVTSAYDAAWLPYPRPHLLWERLIDLDYDRCRDDVPRTICTDFDYVWVLSRLVHQVPHAFDEFRARCERLLQKATAEWDERRETILAKASTHDLYCYVIGWSVYQRVLPEQFHGPALYDTLNAPWLFRLPAPDRLASQEPA